MTIKIFSRFIRFPNLLITALSLILVFQTLIYPEIVSPGAESIILLIAIILGVVSIMIAGNIFNDIYDQTTDKINRSDHVVIGVYISESKAYWWFYLLNSFAIIIAIGLSFFIRSITPLAIFSLAIWLLVFYSKKAKGILILGNVIIAFLCALVFYIVPLCFSDLLGVAWYQEPELLIIIFLLSSLAFFTTMIRELIKDLQDRAGDEQASIKTIANTWSLTKAKKLGYLLGLILLIQLLWATVHYFREAEQWKAIYLMGLLFCLVLLMWSFAQAHTNRQFGTLSAWIKLYILQGLLILLLWL